MVYFLGGSPGLRLCFCHLHSHELGRDMGLKVCVLTRNPDYQVRVLLLQQEEKKAVRLNDLLVK